jgi:single-stranded DNA-binding protein
MMSFAKISIAGTLSATPEKRFTPNNVAVTVLTLQLPPSVRMGQSANTAKAEAPATTVKVVCWRNLADVAEPLPVGQVLLVEGRLQLNTLTLQDGSKKKVFEIDATNLFTLPALPELLRVETAANAGGYNNAPRATATAPVVSTQTPSSVAPASTGFQFQSDLASDDFLTEDDIPF